METVARGLPNLPMVIIFPRTLDDGASLLGLGDIVLPGLFLCFLYRFDHFNNIKFRSGYFLKAWIGYALGLFVTFIMLWVLNRGQPALLYLVPSTIIPTLIFGWKNHQLEDLWKGQYKVSDLKIVTLEDMTGTKIDGEEEDTVSLLHQDRNIELKIEE